MNILIVDDEYYIVKGILDAVDWLALGITEQFTAYSSDQAKKVFEESGKIDIVLSDIEMPRESGLDLADWILNQGYTPVMLFLTGHENFKYAQRAIHLHSFSYILKPADPSVIQNELENAIKACKRKNLQEFYLTKDEETTALTSSDILSLSKDYIRRNLSCVDLNRNMIAEQIHVNPDYLSHVFHKKSGMQLSNYITEERMKYAKNLLAYSKLSIQDICLKSGYANCSYFYRQFKKSCGVTPQQFRKDQ